MSARLIDIVNGFWEVWFYLVPFLLGFALFHWRKLMRRREMRLFLLLGAFALAWRLILFGSGASHFSSRYLGALALFALPPAVYGARELAAELARRLRAPRLAFPLFLALLLLVGGISVAKPFHRSREKKYLTEAAVGIGRFLRERKLSGPCAVIVGGEPERRLLPGPGGRVLFRDRTVDPESFLVSAVAQTLLNGEYAFLLLGGEPAEAFRRRWALEPVRRYGEKTLYFAAHPPFRDPLHGAELLFDLSGAFPLKPAALPERALERLAGYGVEAADLDGFELPDGWTVNADHLWSRVALPVSSRPAPGGGWEIAARDFITVYRRKPVPEPLRGGYLLAAFDAEGEPGAQLLPLIYGGKEYYAFVPLDVSDRRQYYAFLDCTRAGRGNPRFGFAVRGNLKIRRLALYHLGRLPGEEEKP